MPPKPDNKARNKRAEERAKRASATEEVVRASSGSKRTSSAEAANLEQQITTKKVRGSTLPIVAADSASKHSYNAATHRTNLDFLQTAPIYFISTHGQYDVLNARRPEDLFFTCPDNTYIFETAGIQNITSIDIDPLLWYLMQSENRSLFLDIFTNKSDEEILAVHGAKLQRESINAFRHIFKHIIFYGPGQNVPIRKLTLHNIKRKDDWSSYIVDGKFIQTKGRLSTRMTYASMGFWKFLSDSPYYTFPRVLLDYEYLPTISENNNANADENDDESYKNGESEDEENMNNAEGNENSENSSSNMNNNYFSVNPTRYTNLKNLTSAEENENVEFYTEEENISRLLQENARTQISMATLCDKTISERFPFKSEKPRESQGCSRILPELYDILNRTNITSTGKEANDPDAPFITNENIIYQQQIFGETMDKIRRQIENKNKTLDIIKKELKDLQSSTRTSVDKIRRKEGEIQILENEMQILQRDIEFFMSKKDIGNIEGINSTKPNIFIFSSCAEAHGNIDFLRVIKRIQDEAIEKMDAQHLLNPTTELGISNLYIDTDKIKGYVSGQEPAFLEKDQQTQEAIQQALVYIENPAEVTLHHIPYEQWKYRYTYMQDKAAKLGGARTQKRRKVTHTKRRRATTRVQKKQRRNRKTHRK